MGGNHKRWCIRREQEGLVPPLAWKGNRKEWFSEPGKGMRGMLGRNWNQSIANPQERSKFTLLASSKSLLVFVKGQIQLEAKEQESPITWPVEGSLPGRKQRERWWVDLGEWTWRDKPKIQYSHTIFDLQVQPQCLLPEVSLSLNIAKHAIFQCMGWICKVQTPSIFSPVDFRGWSFSWAGPYFILPGSSICPPLTRPLPPVLDTTLLPSSFSKQYESVDYCMYQTSHWGIGDRVGSCSTV